MDGATHEILHFVFGRKAVSQECVFLCHQHAGASILPADHRAAKQFACELSSTKHEKPDFARRQGVSSELTASASQAKQSGPANTIGQVAALGGVRYLSDEGCSLVGFIDSARADHKDSVHESGTLMENIWRILCSNSFCSAWHETTFALRFLLEALGLSRALLQSSHSPTTRIAGVWAASAPAEGSVSATCLPKDKLFWHEDLIAVVCRQVAAIRAIVSPTAVTGDGACICWI